MIAAKRLQTRGVNTHLKIEIRGTRIYGLELLADGVEDKQEREQKQIPAG